MISLFTNRKKTGEKRFMTDIDLKDRKILYHLDLNCRQSNSQIRKKVGLSRKVVEYRINKMEEKGVITGYWTAINTYKLGYYVFRIYINFMDVSSTIKNEIIHYFCNAKNVWAVLTAKGPVDLDVILWVNDVFKFNMKWEETLQKYGSYFVDASVSILNEVISCKKSYLLPKNYDKNRIMYITNCSGQPGQIDETDYRLLDLIALNGRMSTIELADKLNCSSQKINYHLKGLLKKNIIKAFRVSIDDAKLGMKSCAIDVYLKQHDQKQQMIKHVINNSYIFDMMSKSIGYSDFGFQLTIKSMDDVFNIMEELEKKFPNAIRKQESWMSTTCHKERWLPEMSEKDFKK